MPSGITHAKCSGLLAVPAFALAFGAGNMLPPSDQIVGALACSAGCLSGILLTPDLDQEGLSSSESWLIKWTLGLGFLWMMLWYPYARLIPHRSPLSHWPLLGTALRLLYLSPLIAVALHFGWQLSSWPLAPTLWAISGLALSDTAHWLLDTFWSERRPRRR